MADSAAAQQTTNTQHSGPVSGTGDVRSPEPPAPSPAPSSYIPIHPRSVRGRFRTIKYAILALAYGVYFLLPWLRWERAGAPDQAVLFDIPDRRFYLFDLIVHPQDMYWLAGILIIAAMLLFFVTGIAGRVFCGYFCFQTLWTDVFVLVERWVQGERPARIRLDQSPWTADKIRKKGLTHLGWLVVAFATGLAFTLYWGNAPELLAEFFTGAAPFPAYATTAFLTATTYVMAGHAREAVCTHMCPYSRFQSAMFDRDTLIVAYDERRGEGEAGRHKIAKGLKTREERHAAGVGDCVDCGYCVQVCPTGIDIRDGLQIQCISCALCIDACDTVMDRLGWPRGLIQYTSEAAQRGERTRIVKPKNVGYAVALVAAIGLLAWSIASRAPFEAAVYQVRQPLYVQLADGGVRNSYEITLHNMTQRPLDFELDVRGLPDAQLDLGRVSSVHLPPDGDLTVLAHVRVPAGAVPAGGTPYTLTVRSPDIDGEAAMLRRELVFYAPGAGGE